MDTWRLILSRAKTGAQNMALDEAILESVSRGHASPTLRLYSWAPPCLSLGYAQPVEDVQRDSLVRLGWDLVRRPTGGRAILHTDELTYAVICPQHEPRVRGGVLESYRSLSRGLIAGLTRLGLRPEATPLSGGEGADGPVCFEVPSNYEVTLKGRKLIGSAQLRRMGGVLQHGSIPLCGDLGRIVLGLRVSEEDLEASKRRVRERAVTVEEGLGHAVTWEQAAEALAEGFAQALDLEWSKEDPTSDEMARAEILRSEKYGSSAWTERV